ncbi:MAG: crossover junction endodeoxyribonuclease RuvC [Methylophaga sp.]|nr:crossover junction endodeoxyribonuclease RuvC [Methylophaga sp.]
MSRILGVDPGSRKTGFGIIELQGKQIKHVINGRLLVGDGDFADRLKQIFDGLTDLIQRYQPEIMAVEKVFLHKNADSALKLGQARGAAICAAVSQNLIVHEYSATQIKKAVVGNGHAQKDQVQYMMSVMLQLNEPPAEDAADALACAITHANHASVGMISKLPEGMRTSRRRGGRYSR